MKLPKCIFCLTTDSLKFNTKEHIIPESLGGGDWCILHEGLFCDSCQNIFGSTIEQQALATNPLIMFRTLFGIPTKKLKQPWFTYWEGKITSALKPGVFHYEPNKVFEKPFIEGKKTLTIVSSEVKKPDMLARTLLKIGLQTIADDEPDKVFQKRFDAAREYALTGDKTSDWGLCIKNDNKLCNYFLKNHSPKEYSDNFFSSVIDLTEKGDSPVVLHLKLLYLDFVIPLTEDFTYIKNLETSLEPDEKIIIL